MLPKLHDSIPDNSSFANDLPAVRLIKLLSKESLSSRLAIQITTDQFIIFLDYEVISETSSIDEALCIVISLYVIFELQFEDQEGGDMITTKSTNSKTLTATVESLTQVEDSQTDDLSVVIQAQLNFSFIFRFTQTMILYDEPKKRAKS
ncbi:unnamed protein product [Adineta steineri]|uniref:Uncharacterized protein n=1 Tax=Adineta steineri TaxID=433720 RepID=A0A816ASK9_9BILA|nr:unnamed protein product [Adineta steineri]CAF1600813.1 unnamed protein product [Adineta steineri]